jgi:DNA repair exonuclease SbcCD ATPase subunit
MFAPVREIVFRHKVTQEPQVITRGDELEEVMERIRDRTVERLRERVALLDAGQERMARNFTTINEYFQPFAAEQRATAKARMEKYIGEVLPRQEHLTELLLKARDGGDLSAPMAYHQEWMSRILTAQEEIRRGIRLLELGGEELLEAQHAAEEKQFEVNQFIRWLEGDLGSIEWNSKRLSELKREKPELIAQLGERGEALATTQMAVDKARPRVDEWEKTYAEAREGRDWDRIRVVKQGLDEAKRTLHDAERRYSDAERDHRQTLEQLTRTEDDLVKVTESLATARRNREEHIVAGGNVQRAATEMQKAVIETARTLWAAQPPPEGGE